MGREYAKIPGGYPENCYKCFSIKGENLPEISFQIRIVQFRGGYGFTPVGFRRG
jgi:hypothetical protein